MPLPKGNWSKATNIEHYKVFATHDDALRWFEGFAKRNQMEAKPLPLTDVRYSILEKELDIIWKAFVDLFERDTEGLTKPPLIVLTDSQELNAFAFYDGTLGVSPHVFIVNAGVFNSSAKTQPELRLQHQLRGLFAHELAHHVLKHEWPGNDEKVQKWYSVETAIENGFGWQQKDDPKLRDKGLAYLTGVTDAGEFPLAEWNGMPRPPGRYQTTLAYVHRSSKAAEPIKCAESEAAYSDIADYLATTKDPASHLPSFNAPAVRRRLDELTRAYVEKERACGASSTTSSLWAVFVEQTGKSEAALKSQTSPVVRALIDNAATPTDALFALVKGTDQRSLSLGDISKLRYYSAEEEADDVAINVLFRAGHDANALAHFLEYRDEKSAKACAAAVSLGEPEYGALSDPHHNRCWRIWHSQQLLKHLSTKQTRPVLVLEDRPVLGWSF